MNHSRNPTQQQQHVLQQQHPSSVHSTLHRHLRHYALQLLYEMHTHTQPRHSIIKRTAMYTMLVNLISSHFLSATHFFCSSEPFSYYVHFFSMHSSQASLSASCIVQGTQSSSISKSPLSQFYLKMKESDLRNLSNLNPTLKSSGS